MEDQNSITHSPPEGALSSPAFRICVDLEVGQEDQSLTRQDLRHLVVLPQVL